MKRLSFSLRRSMSGHDPSNNETTKNDDMKHAPALVQMRITQMWRRIDSSSRQPSRQDSLPGMPQRRMLARTPSESQLDPPAKHQRPHDDNLSVADSSIGSSLGTKFEMAVVSDSLAAVCASEIDDEDEDVHAVEDVTNAILNPQEQIRLPRVLVGDEECDESLTDAQKERFAKMRRWNQLAKQLSASSDLDALCTLIRRGFGAGDCAVLAETLLDEDAHLFDVAIPAIARYALDLPALFPTPLAALVRQKNRTLTISQRQAAALLAHAFLCSFDVRHRGRMFPSFNLSGLFDVPAHSYSIESDAKIRRTKLRFILHYFECVSKIEPTGYITFHRQVIPQSQTPDWPMHTSTLISNVTIRHSRIEDINHASQVDFANEYVGGGVLDGGAVQEEILFLIMPELIVSRLLAERLEDNESLLVVGAQRYSDYAGYSRSLKWAGHHDDTLSTDDRGRRRREIVMIDAKAFSYRNCRYECGKTAIKRELLKAYAGFSGSSVSCMPQDAPIATGNWGCGAFNGTLHLKALIQLMAASVSGRSLIYCPFDQKEFANKFVDLVRDLQKHEVTVAKLYSAVLAYRESAFENRYDQNPSIGLFEHVRNFLNIPISMDHKHEIITLL